MPVAGDRRAFASIAHLTAGAAMISGGACTSSISTPFAADRELLIALGMDERDVVPGRALADPAGREAHPLRREPGHGRGRSSTHSPT